MFHVYNKYHYKRVTSCVALQIMADAITVDNVITLEAQEHIRVGGGGGGGGEGGLRGLEHPPPT